MRKRLLLLLFACSLAIRAEPAWAQVDGYLTADPNPFQPGSTIAVNVNAWWDYAHYACENQYACRAEWVYLSLWGSDGFTDSDEFQPWNTTYASWILYDNRPGQTLEGVTYTAYITVIWLDMETGFYYSADRTVTGGTEPIPPPAIPTGEVTLEGQGGWAPEPDKETAYDWIQALQGGSFMDRNVDERSTGHSGLDNCDVPGDAVDPFDMITGVPVPWHVSSSDNRWYFDTVGYRPEAVDHYRRIGQDPCDTTFYQVMVIDCNDPRCSSNWVQYQTNTLRAGLTYTMVWSERAGAWAGRIWP
jgi:hypothetical protein